MTILVVVSVCSPINRFPFDCFFSFQTVFVSCRDSRRFFCVGQFSGVQTRPIVVAHAPSPLSISLRRHRGYSVRNAPFFVSSSRLTRSSRFLAIFFRSPYVRDLNMQNDFFSLPRRLLPLFGPPRPHNYRVAGK